MSTVQIIVIKDHGRYVAHFPAQDNEQLYISEPADSPIEAMYRLLGDILGDDDMTPGERAKLEGFLVADDDEDTDHHWLCVCGHYETSGLHCSVCKAEPPWGCDCSFCHERWMEQTDEDDDFLFIGGPWEVQEDVPWRCDICNALQEGKKIHCDSCGTWYNATTGQPAMMR
jgi:hypothetical protein